MGYSSTRRRQGSQREMYLQLMNQTDAMVTEKNSPGLRSTFTSAAVRAKSSSMASRLPRIRTDSGMLLRRGQRTSGGHQEQMGIRGRAVELA